MKRFQHYSMETAVHGVTDSSKGWLEDQIKELLEKNIHFTQKADILSYAFLSIDDKISSVNEQIRDLQDYKKSLKESSSLAKEVVAEVFNQYGISKLDGGTVSSITVSKAIRSSKLEVKYIYDTDALIEAGYYKKVLDEKKMVEVYMTGDASQKEIMEEHCKFVMLETTIPQRIKINKRRASNNNMIIPDSDDIKDAS